MENRSFQIGTEWNVIYYPEKPTGFGVLIIGDERHFVDENRCFWSQNEGKLAIIHQLKAAGYTVFSSNLYGRHWGSESAAELAQRLYQHVIRSEILNNKIHILAEGMGALVALKLMKKMNEDLRSVIFLNPVLSLRHHLEQEKEHKFFYKKMMRELAAAYQQDHQILESEILGQEDIVSLEYGVPIKIIHVLSGGKAYNQSKLIKKIVPNIDLIDKSYILPEKKQQLGRMFINFFKSHETVL